MTPIEHQIKSLNQITVHFESENPSHIGVVELETTLCGDDVIGGVIDVVPHDTDPVATGPVNLCSDCVRVWADEGSQVPRAETVVCECDRIRFGEFDSCGRVIPAAEARGLHHPSAENGKAPVCRDCYEWLLEHPQTSVSQSYEEAPSWRKLIAEV